MSEQNVNSQNNELKTAQACIEQLSKYLSFKTLNETQLQEVAIITRRYCYLEWNMNKEYDLHFENQKTAGHNVGGTGLPASDIGDVDNERKKRAKEMGRCIVFRGKMTNTIAQKPAEVIHLIMHEIRHVKQDEVLNADKSQLSEADLKLRETLERDLFTLDGKTYEKIPIDKIQKGGDFQGKDPFWLAWGAEEIEHDADSAASLGLKKVLEARNPEFGKFSPEIISKTMDNHSNAGIVRADKKYRKSDKYYALNQEAGEKRIAEKERMHLEGKRLFPQYFKQLPKEEIAELLGITVEQAENLNLEELYQTVGGDELAEELSEPAGKSFKEIMRERLKNISKKLDKLRGRGFGKTGDKNVIEGVRRRDQEILNGGDALGFSVENGQNIPAIEFKRNQAEMQRRLEEDQRQKLEEEAGIERE